MISGLDQIFLQDAHAGQVVEQLLLSNKKWGARDRNFIAENLYTVIRYYRLYCYGAGLTEISTISEAWQVLGAYFIDIDQEGELPAWPEWEGTDRDAVKASLAEGRTIRAVAESIPDWIDELGADEVGEQWPEMLHALNQPAPLCIRVNTLKATMQSVAEFLKSEEIEYSTVAELPDAIIIQSRKNIRNSYAYKSGWFEVQDSSSQLVVPMLDVKPGMKVIDACAGAGGKALHIAARMCDRGELIAMDIYADKLKELESRARRNSVTCIRTVLSNSSIEHNFKEEADRLLLDVPCSALGVLRRNPDTKWKLTPHALQEVLTLQQSLLRRYSMMVKPGGIMVYATCSILPSENEKQIEDFLADHPAFQKVSERRIMPGESGGDGFYICQMIKNI